MNTAILPLFSALVAGCIHALEADHMAAVTTFVSRRPHPARAFGFGLRWGLGHSVALLLAGGLLVLADVQLPDAAVRALEGAVGAMLAALGVWVLVDLIHARRISAAHEHAHAIGARHVHLGGTTWVGAAHGLAGTAGFLALVPATVLATPWLAAAYLVLFGVGTMLSMGLYAVAAGMVFHRAGGGAPRLARVLRALAGCVSVGVGILWIARALG